MHLRAEALPESCRTFLPLVALSFLAACDSGGGHPSGLADPGPYEGPALMHVLTGDNALQLLDPALPTSATNPVTVDAELPRLYPSAPLYSVRLDSHGVTSAVFADRDNAAGTFSNRRTVRLAYVKGGKVFRVNTTQGAIHTPIRISAIADACQVLRIVSDNTDVDNKSWAFVWRAGPDHDCAGTDNTVTAIRINAGESEAGIALPAHYELLEPLYDTAGAITGFLATEHNPLNDGSTPAAATTLTLRSANLAPVTVLAVMEGTFPPVVHVRASRTVVYLMLQPSGANHFRLSRYDAAARTLTTFHSLTGKAVPQASADADNFYFSDNDVDYSVSPARFSGTVYKVPHHALTVTPLTRAVDGQLWLYGITATRVLFFGRNAVFSVPKNAFAESPTVLLRYWDDRLPLVTYADPAGLVYITVVDPSASPGTCTAVRIADDGSGMLSIDNAAWSFGALRNKPPELPPFEMESLLLIKATATGADLESIAPTSGATNFLLGSIPNASVTPHVAPPVFSLGLDRYAAINVPVMRDDGSVDTDAFIADLDSPNSLEAISTVPGPSDAIFGGGGH